MPIDPALLRRLRENDKTLTTLDFERDCICDEGAKALADVLKINRTLSTLVLWNNEISDEGAKALADALKVNRTLSTLFLRGNSIGKAGGQALSDALQHNFSLCQITDVDLSRDAKACLERNRKLQLVKVLQIAEAALSKTKTIFCLTLLFFTA